MKLEDFFDGIENNYQQYITRPDCLGGEIYVRLRKIGGKKILSIGGEEGEIDIKCVADIIEVNKIIDALLG